MNDRRLPNSAETGSETAAAADSCRWVRIQVPRFLDAELPEDLAARVFAHIARCGACAEELARAEDEIVDVVDCLVAAEPPAGLLARLHVALDDEIAASAPARPAVIEVRGSRHRRFVRSARAFGPGLAAAALLAGILWGGPERSARTAPATARAPAIERGEDAALRDEVGERGLAAGVPERTGADALASLDPGSPDENELLFSGGIECITFEEAIDTVIVGPLDWRTDHWDSGPWGARASAARLVRRGDIDGNGRFEWRDLQGLFGYLREGREGEAPPECLAAADFDGDGAVTVHDSVIAAQALARSAEWTASSPEVFAYESDNPLPCRTSCP